MPIRSVTVEHLLCIRSRLGHWESLQEPNRVVVSTVNLVIEHGRGANGLTHQAVEQETAMERVAAVVPKRKLVDYVESTTA